MADIRSAAGEGSEPRVPAQAEPAHELAKLIAESDAKSKGFWRRLRKPKAGTTSATPSSAEPADAAASPKHATEPPKPVEGPGPEAEPDTDQSTLETAAGASESKAAGSDTKPDADASDDEAKVSRAEAEAKVSDAEPVAKAEPGSDAESTAKAERDADAEAETAVGQEPDSKSPSSAEAGSESEAGSQSADEPGAKAGADTEPGESPEVVAEGNDAESSESAGETADPEGSAGEAPQTEDAAGTAAQTGESVGGASRSEEAAGDVPADTASEVAAESAGEKVAGEEPAGATASDESVAERAEVEPEDEKRPTVGVVYEPDESPDGFPLEYGDIIIGLPKTPEPKQKMAKRTTAGSAGSADADPEDDAGAELAEIEKAEIENADTAPETADAEPETADPELDAAEADTDAAPETPEAKGDVEPEPETDGEPEPAEPKGDAAPEPEADGEPEPAKADVELETGEAESGVAEPEADKDESGPDGAEAKAETIEAETKDVEPVAESARMTSEGVEPEAMDVELEAGSARATSEGADEEAAQPEVEVEPETNVSESEDAESAVEGADAELQRDEAGDGPASEGGEQAAEAGTEDGAAVEASAVEGAAAGGGSVVPAEATEVAAAAAEKSAAEQAAMALITALMRLRGALASSKLPIDVVGADEARQQQKSMLDQLDDYILPRLVQLEAPVLAVVGGSTGAGKSTLVNSLIGQVVSEPGVLRPTTRSPVLIHNPVDAEWFTGDRVLPGMARSSGEKPGGMEDPGQIRLVAADTVPPGLAILDAPDIDSVVEANRELATQLLAAADLWLFVTTAARYADAVPWEFLQSASDRSTAVAVVLDRAPADTIDDITGHLAQMLLERGLGDSPLFSIKETVVDGNGMLPAETVASIKDWLTDLAADAEGRSAVVRRTLHGAVTAMTKKTPAFATAVRAQADTVVELRSNAETAYERSVKDIAKATQDGTMLRGEVLARWQEFVGTGELLKGLQTNVGRLRDKVRTSVVGKPPPTRDLNDAVESGLESLLREHAEAAAERAEESWQSLAAGRQLLAAGDKDMGRMSKEFPAAASRAVRDWQGYVLDLVRKEGAEKRSTARILAYGVNGLGLALIIVIFASTAGVTGAEIGLGAGTAVVGQKLLEAVFGDQAVRTLAAKARDDLDGRVHALMDAEFARYLAVLDQHPVDPDAPRRLTEAARAVEDCT